MALSDAQYSAAERAGLVLKDPFQAPDPDAARYAPWPVNDRYPVVIGANVTLQYVSNVLRMCTSGYRREFVDLLSELLERDTHTQGVMTSRIQTVAGGRLEVLPADCEDSEKEQAAEVAAYVERQFRRIVDLRGSIAAILWAIFYGASCAEVSWTRDESGIRPARLHFVHSRRLNFPAMDSWEMRIWDQGQVGRVGQPRGTENLFGIAPADYPGKFVTFMPQVRGDYPTREGVGRVVVWYMAMKLMAMRGLASSAERFGKPWVIGYYATGAKDGEHRVASKEDVEALDLLVRGIGTGTSSGGAIPDSLRVAVERITSGKGGLNPFHELIDVCNAEISKAILTQTLTTESGSKGARALGQVHEKGAMRVAQSDAEGICEVLRWQLAATIVRVNMPHLVHLVPKVQIIIEDEPDAENLIKVAAELADRGAPVDADALAGRCGIPLVPRDAKDGRRLVPLSPVAVRDLEALNAGEPLPEEAPKEEPRQAGEEPEDDEQDPEEGDEADEGETPPVN